MQLIIEHLATVVSACQAAMDQSWHKEGSIHELISTKKKSMDRERMVILPKSSQARKKQPPHCSKFLQHLNASDLNLLRLYAIMLEKVQKNVIEQIST